MIFGCSNYAGDKARLEFELATLIRMMEDAAKNAPPQSPEEQGTASGTSTDVQVEPWKKIAQNIFFRIRASEEAFIELLSVLSTDHFGNPWHETLGFELRDKTGKSAGFLILPSYKNLIDFADFRYPGITYVENYTYAIYGGMTYGLTGIYHTHFFSSTFSEDKDDTWASRMNVYCIFQRSLYIFRFGESWFLYRY